MELNTTPARNTNNNYIELTKKQLTDLFDRLTEWEKEHDPEKECYGYAGIPYCLKRTRETGVDKIFFVGRNYHGKYEDDYCYFTYWDEEKKEFFEDEWGTWAAFPSYDYYEMPISFDAGWNEGLIDKNAYLEVMKKFALNSLASTEFTNKFGEDYILRVKIEKGRKWKGEGYLVRVDESSYRFATPRFRNHCEGFGVSTTYTAVIWDPITNTINRANANYLQFLDKETIMEKYNEWAKAIIEHAGIWNLTPSDNCNKFNHKLNVDYSLKKFMEDVWMPSHFVDVSDAYDPEEEERKKKASEFRATKMPEIIEWVKTNTDKQGEDIILLAIHIFNKRYA